MPGIGYDSSGNLTSQPNAVSGSDTLVYDAENHQTSYTKAGVGTTTYSYDGDGRRVKRTDPTNNTTIFVYDVAGQLIAEYTSGTPSGGGTSYLTSDHLGSTRVVTSAADGNGNVTVKARYDYLPFGEEIGSDRGSRTLVTGYGATDGTRQKFTQKERDNESGLDYFLARYYSSAQGRFTSPDEFKGGPHEVFGGVSDSKEKVPLPYADVTNPQSLNKYSYCYNSPLAFVDPDGHNPLFWALAAVGAMLAGADTANAPGRHDPIYKSEQGGNVAVTIAANAAFGAALKYASSFLATSASKLFKAATVERAEAMVLANAERGGQFANQTHGIVGTVQNTERILQGQATGAAYRIPDMLSHIDKVLGEIKGVQNLSNTGQLRDFIGFAKETGYSFNLYVKPDTTLTKELIKNLKGIGAKVFDVVDGKAIQRQLN